MSIRIDVFSHYFQKKNIAWHWQKATKVPIVSYRNMQIIILHFEIFLQLNRKIQLSLKKQSQPHHSRGYEVTSRQKASWGQRFPCPASLML